MERRPSARDKAAFRAWSDRWDAVHAVEVREWRRATVEQRFAILEDLTRFAHDWIRLHPDAATDEREEEEAARIRARWQRLRENAGRAATVAGRARSRPRRAPRMA